MSWPIIYRETDPARNARMELAFGLDLGVIDERDNSSIINTSMLVHLPRIRYPWYYFETWSDPDEAKERSIRREISKGIS